jgi:hypothetical protein
MRYLVCKKVDSTCQCKYQNPYKDGMRVWHESFELAKKEADRLCEKEISDFVIFAEIGIVKPSPKTIFEDYRSN